MISVKGLKDARPRYYQIALSGFEDYLQQRNSNRKSDEDSGVQAPGADFWEQSSYKVTIEFIVEKVSVHGDEFNLQFLLNANTNVSMSPYNPRSKATSQQVFTVPQASHKKAIKVPMVFRILKEWQGTLSHPAGTQIHEGIARIYSLFLDQADRAIQCLVFNAYQKEAPIVEPGVDTESPSSSKSVRANKGRKRSTEIPLEIHLEETPKAATQVAAIDRQILGNGQGNG